jgi:suppressor of fused protein SUFU
VAVYGGRMLGRWRKGHGREPEERSASGNPILRHQARERGWQAPTYGDPAIREALEAHLAGHLGESGSVWHEIVSDLVHLDVFTWAPTPDRPMHTFVTVGMSDLPMTVPPGALAQGHSDRAELVVCLPPDWPVPDPAAGSMAPWDDPDAYFPIRWLKQLARLPHEYDTWLGFGHTIPNGDPAEPLASTTGLCGWLLLPPMTLPESFRHVDLPGGGRLDLFGITALHRAEMDHKLDHGVEALFDGFDAAGVSELLDLHRPSTKP